MSRIDDATQNMIQNLQVKTGKSLDEWVAIAQSSGHTKHKSILDSLKTEHGLSYGYANLVALTMLDRQSAATVGDDDLLTQQYAGAKANLRPLYDALIEQIHSFGDDVEIAPKKAYVSLRRNRQFAIIQPSTASRLDVGINLKGSATTERLEASGNFNSMVSHRVRVTSLAEIDGELIEWLRLAYTQA